MFLSTPPRGERREPTWGKGQSRSGFYPRPREGSDGEKPYLSPWVPWFLSTPPRGERPEVGVEMPHIQICFYPRPREGSDDLRPKNREAQDVSIHAPARGATRKPYAKPRNNEVSIHAPARGATYAGTQRHEAYQVSIHAPARGATGPAGALVSMLQEVSIHAPARGATRHLDLIAYLMEFLSTPPRGERRL